MAINNDSIKFHVGKFSVTDKSGALIVTAKVETSKEYTDGIFWLECRPFSKEEKYISVAFDAVSLRAFAYGLKELQYQSINEVEKHSGGNKMIKSLTVKTIERYSSFQFKEQDTMLYFRLPTNHLYGLATQIEHLVDITMDSSYKTQQYKERKKKETTKSKEAEC